MLSEVANYLNAKLNLVPALWLLLTLIIHFYEKGFTPITAKLIQIQSHWFGNNYAHGLVSCINFISTRTVRCSLSLGFMQSCLFVLCGWLYVHIWVLCVIVQNTCLTCKLLKSNIEIQFLTQVLNKSLHITAFCDKWPRTSFFHLSIIQSVCSLLICSKLWIINAWCTIYKIVW